ncbi:MAG TPA: SUMF1/EgtB/PvdO family nonheme iron enzyme [Cyclobacteriaceae bacterium]|nr:SUMF1/EgtB/PvdO family nonheme iron enzyme [Cyclobacteriaceae bacterium]HPW61066.1 SUMF1/EgtB/PvdO family nonheme iron enzyme [Cyclobacteriaceae bacterium]
MKKILIIPLVLIGLVLQATPEKIYPKTKILKPISWYSDQMLEWGSYVQSHSTEADAWLNFYAATRFAQRDAKQLNLIVEKMSTAIPNTFEYYLIQGWHAGFGINATDNLTKAYEIKPEHSGSYGLLMLASEFQGNEKNRKFYAKKMHEAGILSASLLSYSYNVLMSVEPGSVLFTEGDNTTLPLLALQDVWNVRPDVTVLNLDMISYPDYRKSKLVDAGLVLSGITENNPDFKQLICAALPVKNPDRKFYYALTLSKENIADLKDQLYVVGLASQLSQTRIDNISLIKDNLEKRFLLDYLAVDFNGTSQFDTGNVLSSNYLVPLLLLYEHYEKNGEKEKQTELGELIFKIAASANKEELVNNFLTRNITDGVPYFPGALNAKSLEGRFRPITDKLLAEEAEVRNEQYNEFLAYLVKNNLNDLYKKYKFDLSKYDEPALSMMKNYTAARIITKKEKYFTQYPAVNISYEAAVAYCSWLTDQYNGLTEKKYKKVKFRLPTIEEYQIAAASIKNPTSWNIDEQMVEVKLYPAGKEFGKDFELKKVSAGDPDVLYPWFRVYNYRNSPRNQKNCYLGNFKTPDNEKPCMPERMTSADGWMMMGPVETYFPNDIGLYDVVGNVAEMTSEKGKACGGSWNHPPEESTIKSVNLYEGPDAAIGFRVFMEIIEQ